MRKRLKLLILKIEDQFHKSIKIKIKTKTIIKLYLY